MNSEELVLSAMRGLGRSDALSLRQRANDMTGTEIIAEEQKAPAWASDKDYTTWPAGAPVVYDGQLYKLLRPTRRPSGVSVIPQTLQKQNRL